jgi:hypothetical protein
MPKVGRMIRKIPAARLMAVAEVLMLARQHLMKLEPHERRRIVELVRRGRGRPGHLSERERRELARLVEKTEPREFAKSAMKKVAGISLPRSGRSSKPS